MIDWEDLHSSNVLSCFFVCLLCPGFFSFPYFTGMRVRTLILLVSNFLHFITIKLDSSNFALWKTQVINALRANGFLGYIDGTIGCPESQITDSNGVLVDNPACILWKMVDVQLLSCITATISVSTLPYVLGLSSINQLWQSLDNRFCTMTKSHVHY